MDESELNHDRFLQQNVVKAAQQIDVAITTTANNQNILFVVNLCMKKKILKTTLLWTSKSIGGHNGKLLFWFTSFGSESEFYLRLPPFYLSIEV